MNIKDQVHKENYTIYCADNMEVLPQLADESVDLSVYSPPFAGSAGGLFTYSSDPRDMSNCSSREQFMTQYEFIVEQMARVTKAGRINAIHCMDICDSFGYLYDFPHDIIELHKKYGFDYRSRVTVWKEPLKVRMRTMVTSLMHKFIMEDSTRCFPATPDYILIFSRKGECKVPVTHKGGLTEYAGEIPILPHMTKAWNNQNNTNFTDDELWEHLKNTHVDGEISKLNHYIWQRYASSVWDDIRIDNVVPFRESKDEDDERHIHPLQLDVIERLVDLYSNPEEIILSPFMGVSSEVYGAIKRGRKGIGVELKESYYRQAVLNMLEVERIVRESSEQISFDDIGYKERIE